MTRDQPSANRPTSFAHRIAQLQQGEHLCSVYAESGEMLSQAVPYMKAGLLNGERCIYVADESTKENILHALMFWGVDADRAMSGGQLAFWTRHDYRQPGAFDLNTMLSFVRRTLDKALADGHRGIRLAVEMSWTINNGVSDEDLIRWEDFLNTISFPESNVSFLCQYNSRLLSSSAVAKAVHVHPVVILGQDICPNRYCRSANDILTDRNHDELTTLLGKLKPSDSSQSNLGVRV
jgi:hypothetical protein